MDLKPYIHIIYSVIVWGYAFIFIKPRRIRELLPVGVLAAILLFCTSAFLQSMSLYRYNTAPILIYGIPLFHLLWGFGGGIIYVHYMRKYANWQFPTIVLFVIFTLIFEYTAELLGATSHLGTFNELFEAYLDFLVLSTLIWVSNGLWNRRTGLGQS